MADWFREGRGASSRLKLFNVFLGICTIMFLIWLFCVFTQPDLSDSLFLWANGCWNLIVQAFTPSVSEDRNIRILSTIFNALLLIAEIVFIGWFVWWKRLLRTLQHWRSNSIQDHPLFWSVSALVVGLIICLAVVDALSGSGIFFSLPIFLPIYNLLDRLYFINSAIDKPFALASLNWFMRYILFLLSVMFFRFVFPFLKWLFDKAMDSFINFLNYSGSPTSSSPSASTSFWDALVSSLFKRDSTGRIIGIHYGRFVFLIGVLGFVAMEIRYLIDPVQTADEFSIVLKQAYTVIDGLFFLSALPKDENSLPIWQLFANFFQVLLRFAMAYLYLLTLQFIKDSLMVTAGYLKSIPKADFLKKIKWPIILLPSLIVIVGGAWLLINATAGQQSESNPWIDGTTFLPIFAVLLNMTAAVFVVLVFVTIVVISIFSLCVLGITLWSQIGTIDPAKLKTMYAYKSKQITDALWIALESIVRTVLSVLDIVTFVFCNAISALKVQILSLLGIIRGFERESDKNRALLLAAVFASISSILNTYFGLVSLFGVGNQYGASTINRVTAILVSLAVQIFLLVVGIKAGEGFAERIFLGESAFPAIKHVVIRLIGLVTILGIIVYGFSVMLQSKMSPVFLILCGAFGVLMLVNLVFALAMFRREYKRLRSRGSAASTSGGSPSITFGSSNSGVRRTSPWLYLVAFAALMLISTSFAYNNLFGFYSKSAKLPDIICNNVEYASKAEYDDVKNGYILSADSESDLATSYELIGLEQFIFDKANELIGLYNSNAMEMLKLLDSAYNGTTYSSLPSPASSTRTISMPEARGRARAKYRFVSGVTPDATIFDMKTDGWQNFYDALIEIIQAGDLGNIDITTNTYHYAYEQATNSGSGITQKSAPIHNSVEFVINRNGNSEIIRVVNKKSFTITRSATPTSLGIFDTNYTNYKGLLTTQKTLNTNQFELIRMILREFNGRSQQLYLDPHGVSIGASSTFDILEFERLLRENEIIFRQYRSILGYMEDLCSVPANSDDLFKGGVASIKPLITEILKDDQPFISIDNEYVLAAAQFVSSPDSLTASPITFQIVTYDNRLEPYIDKIAALSRLLDYTSKYDTDVATEDTTDTSTTVGDGSFRNAMKAARDKTKNISTYLNYARAVESPFILSYDVLFGGELGINPATKQLNDVYSSRVFAILLLLVAALIDTMAFLIGLMLFKSVFLFKWGNKTVQGFGYIQLDSVLRSIFALSKNESLLSLQKAFINSLLYGNNDISVATMPNMSSRAKRRQRIRYRKYYDRISSTLQSFGVDLTKPEDKGALIVWVSDFINTP